MAGATLFSQAVIPLCVLLGLYFFKIISTYTKLMQFRGPLWTGISNWPHSIALLRENCHEWYAEVNEKHGERRPSSKYLLRFESLLVCHIS